MTTPAPGSSDRVRWYHRPVGVLLLLFVILGPLGLPYLWRSPGFSRGMKVALTLCVAVYTGLLISETIRIMHLIESDPTIASLLAGV